MSKLRIVVAVIAMAAAANSLANAMPRVEIETTLGKMVVELEPDKAPQTVANFLALVDDGFYEGLIFHRVLANFAIQAGGFDVKMRPRERPHQVVNESANGLKNLRWTLAMAREEDPDSAAAQFFINMKDNPHLDARPGAAGYTVFGRLIGGADVAEAIELSDTGIYETMVGVPVQPIIIVRVSRI